MIGTSGIYWGVDSTNPIHAGRAWGQVGMPPNVTIFDHLREYVGSPPEFWGRYLNRKSTRLTVEEVEQLREHIQSVRASPNGRRDYTCKIVPIYNRWSSEPERYIGAAARRNGLADAQDAANSASALNVPSGVCIYVDVERDRVSSAYFEGWFEGMYASHYYGAGGVYGNSWQHNFTSRAGVSEGWRMQIDDAFAAFEQYAVRSWQNNPYAFASNHSWANASSGNNTSSALLETLVYTNRRREGRGYLYVNGDAPTGDEIYMGQVGKCEAGSCFEGYALPGLPEENTVIWQYAGNMFLGTDAQVVDYNLARQKGYDAMWDPMA